MLFGELSGQKRLKVKMGKIWRPGPFRMTRPHIFSFISLRISNANPCIIVFLFAHVVNITPGYTVIKTISIVNIIVTVFIVIVFIVVVILIIVVIVIIILVVFTVIIVVMVNVFVIVLIDIFVIIVVIIIINIVVKDVIVIIVFSSLLLSLSPS